VVNYTLYTVIIGYTIRSSERAVTSGQLTGCQLNKSNERINLITNPEILWA